MLTDFTKSCRDLIIGRTTSPLFGAFLTSWLVWNYRTLLVIFSDGDYAEKIEFIQTKLYPTPHEAYSYAFAGPLITAIAILLIYPFPARWFFDFTHKKHIALLQSRDKIEELKPISEKDALELRKKILHKEREYSDTITEKQEQIEALNALISDLREAAKKPVDEYNQRITSLVEELKREREEKKQLQIRIGTLENPQDPDINEDCIQILRILSEKGGNLEYHSLRGKTNPVLFRHYLDKITGAGLVELRDHIETRDHRAHQTLSLTAYGRLYVVNKNLLSAKSL